jgi:hypothetical protein
MTRARDNSFNPFNNQAAGKNLCINGGFDIWQRGTSFASSNSVYVFTTDRWEIVRHGYHLGMTVSRQTAGLDGFRYCARIQRDSGNTSTNDLQFQTSFETSEVLPFINKQMTVSFYARKSPTASSSSINPRVIAGTGTDQAMKNYTGGTISFQQTFTLANDWQRFSFSGTVASPYNEFGIWFGYNPTGTAGAADYVEITGVQLELGSSATQFSRAGGTLSGELGSCQRYFQTPLNSADSIYENLAVGTAWSQNRILYNRPITPMRVVPSIAISSVGDFTVENGPAGAFIATNYDTFDLSNRHISGSFYCTGTPFTAGHSARIRASGTANARYYLSAEL